MALCRGTPAYDRSRQRLRAVARALVAPRAPLRDRPYGGETPLTGARARASCPRPQADVPFENLGANQPPGPGAPPRSVVFSRDGVFVEGGPAMRKAGTNLI